MQAPPGVSGCRLSRHPLSTFLASLAGSQPVRERPSASGRTYALDEEQPAIATPPSNNEPRINDRIRAREVRLVGPDGEQVGIKTLPDALNFARELDLDLVEVADKANPPVCRVMDYGKYKYETAQKAKESRRKSTNVVIKEMKYRPKIGGGDFETKTKKVEKFLSEGHKVKITIMFRGREVAHPELGKKILDRVAEEIINTGRVEVYPKLDGPRNMIMVLAPDRKAQLAHAAEVKKALEEAAQAGAATESESVPVDEVPAQAEPAAEVQQSDEVEPEVPAGAEMAPDPPQPDEVEPEVPTGTEAEAEV